MSDSLEQEIRTLRSQFWSERDPTGLAFAPLADAYRRAGDMDQAQELLDDGLSRHPDFSSGYVVAAWIARDQGDAAGASASLQRVLDLDPENVVALKELGELAEERGDSDGALDYYRRLAELEPFDDEIRGRVERVTDVLQEGASGDAGAGIPDVDELELPPDPAARDEAAEEEEVEDLDLADAAAELDAEGSWGRGEAGEVEEDSGEEGELYTATMAELYLRQGLRGQAEDVYRHLLDADPENQTFRERLQEIQEMDVGAPASDPEPEEAPVFDAETPADSAAAPGAEEEGDEVETLAEDLADGPREESEVETPFAWAEDEEEEATHPGEDVAEVGATVTEYFQDLLGWTPGEEAAGESEAPEAEMATSPGEVREEEDQDLDLESVAREEVDSEWVASEEVPPAEELEAEEVEAEAWDVEEAEAEEAEAEAWEPEESSPEAVPVESLAPDVLEPEAPEDAVPVASLAPDEPPADEGADAAEAVEPPPDAVPIASLAPDEPVGEAVADVPEAAPPEEPEEDDPDIAGVLGQIDALGSGSATVEEDEDDDMDDFQKWLDSLKT